MGDFIRDSAVQKWITVFGDVQIIKGLDRLENKMQRKLARRAIYSGLQPIARLAKKLAREETGLLKKSIATKVTRMVSGKVFIDPKVFAMKSDATEGAFKQVKIAGPARGMGIKAISAKLFDASSGTAKFKKPAHYAHLLEFGTRYFPPKPFMRPAMAMGRSAAIAKIRDSIRAALRREGAV